jgi:hypothetical protein
VKPSAELLAAWDASGKKTETTAAVIARRYQDKPAWTRLPAEALASELDVSRAAVYAAWHLLAEHGILQPGDDRSYHTTA